MNTFTIVSVHDRQRPEPRAIDQLVGHEVHGPRLVRSLRHVFLPTRDHHLATPRKLASELQALLGVEPVGLMLSQAPALTLQQHVQAAIPVADPDLRQLTHPTTQRRLGVLARPVVVGASIVLRDPAGPSARKAAAFEDIPHRFSLYRGPGHFFALRSCKMALSKLSSATSFLSRVFSSRSCLSSRTSSEWSPAYCFFQR